MSDVPSLGRRPLEPPANGDLGSWAAGEVAKHEELCGLRYEAIDARMERIEARTKGIEDRISGAIKWVMGIVGSLAVALILMFMNDSKTRAAADESDKREMRARLSLLTAQLANVQPHAVVVAPPGTQVTTPATNTDATPLNPDDLDAAAGGKPLK